MSVESLMQRIQDLDAKLLYLERREAESASRSHAWMQKVESDSQNCGAMVANLELRWARDMERAEVILSEHVQREQRSRAEAERAIRQLIVDESAAVRRLTSSQEQMRVAEAQKWVSDASEQLDVLRRSTEQQLERMKATWGGSLNSMSKDMSTLENTITGYQQRREASEVQLLKLFEETCLQLHQEIVQERTERMESHRRLERLLVESLQM